MLETLALLGFAFSLDLLFGEPPNALHPVAWFGRLVGVLDREWRASERSQRRVGVAIAVFVPLVPATLVVLALVVAASVHPTLAAILAALVLFLTTSLRMLLDLTRAVIDASETDLERARERARGLVGRDTESLDAPAIRSAAIESASENLADGFVATLVPFVVLAPISLPAAAAIAVWIKAVNTLDSMLGYPAKPIGTASARLDDLVMFLPARLTALCLALAATDPAALWRARQVAHVPDSPNSGWPMATLAYVLDVRLEKPGAYVLHADGHPPSSADGSRAIAVVGVAAVFAVLFALVLSTLVSSLGEVIV